MKTYEVTSVETGEILEMLYDSYFADEWAILKNIKSQYLINRVEQLEYNKDTIIVWVHD